MSTSASLTMLKPLTVWITANCGKFKRWDYQTTSPASWEICMQVKKQQLEPDMEHGLVPNWERSTLRLNIISLLFNLYTEYIKWNVGWMKHKLESRLLREISITSKKINNLRLADNTNLMAESEEELKSLLMKVKEESEKAEMKIRASSPITSWQIDGETMETVMHSIFLGFKITANGYCTNEIKKKKKKPCSLKEKLWQTYTAY